MTDDPRFVPFAHVPSPAFGGSNQLAACAAEQ
jgi:hypothetical protein